MIKKKKEGKKGGGGMARKGGVKTEMAEGRRDKRMRRVDGSGKNGGTTEGRHGGKRKEGGREEDWNEEMEWGTRSSGGFRGGAREARASPLNFRPNWGPKGRKKKFLRPGAPLIAGCGWPPPPHPYLRSGSATGERGKEREKKMEGRGGRKDVTKEERN